MAKRKTIIATDNTIKDIVELEIEKYGFQADLNHIDVSNVTDMSYMFQSSKFNGNISKWNTSKVENMDLMFEGSSFNGDISQWDVSNVTEMSLMFKQCAFNSDISKWDVSNVTYMNYMFAESDFNGDISQWDVSNVERMDNMFESSKFNGDISRWDVSNVTEMYAMFSCSSFNNDISQWDVSSVNGMRRMFAGSEFNGDLSEWTIKQSLVPAGSSLDGFAFTDIFHYCPVAQSEDFGAFHLICKAYDEEACKDHDETLTLHPAGELAYVLHKEGMSLGEAIKEGKDFFNECGSVVMGTITDPTEQGKMLFKLYQERHQAQPLIDFTMGLEPSEQAMGTSGFSFDAPDEQSTGLTI